MLIALNLMLIEVLLCCTIAKLFELGLLDQYHARIICTLVLKNNLGVHMHCLHLKKLRYFTLKGGKVYCAFLEASKAFDKVLHNILFVKRLKRNVC